MKTELVHLKNLHIHAYTVACTLYCLLISFQSPLFGQDTLGEGIDCTDVKIDFSDDPSLTQEERLRRMDKAFFESLDKFEYCQAIKNKGKAAGDGESGEGAADRAGESVASSVMSGTETPKVDNASDNSQGTGRPDSQAESQVMNEGSAINNGNMAGSSGKIPEDIPPAENDDILAAQIRYAAENETDPVKRKQLWDEYRKYKGLAPPKN